MFSSFNLLLFFFVLDKTFSELIHPDDYKWVDNPYENDLESTTEDYHYILSATASKEYTDYYKGIHYRGGLCCFRSSRYYSPYSCKYSNQQLLSNFTELSNINETNLKELHHYGCVPFKTNEANIFFTYTRNTPDALISIQIRLTNIYQEPFEFKLGQCLTYQRTDDDEIFCKSVNTLDTYIIPNNSFAIYTFKFDQNYYYIQSENFKIPHPINGYFSPSNNFIQLFYDEDKQLL